VTRFLPMVPLLALAMGLVACTEEIQTVSERQPDAKHWQGTGTNQVAPGWNAGDQESWNEQLRTRAQAQNEYTRIR